MQEEFSFKNINIDLPLHCISNYRCNGVTAAKSIFDVLYPAMAGR
jgi:hypothetical protein